MVGATPVFVDIELGTGTMENMDDIADAVRKVCEHRVRPAGVAPRFRTGSGHRRVRRGR